MIKTKIIATLGPSCCKINTIKEMIDNGVDVFRLNFSHGTLEEHKKMLQAFRTAQAQHPHTTAIMGDLCGPKVRTGLIEPEGQILKKGQQVVIVNTEQPGNAKQFGTNYEYFARDVSLHHRIFIDDGKIALKIIKCEDNKTICKVITGGPLYSHKDMNLPDSEITTASITKRDWNCVDWAVKNNLDFLALSFVRSENDIKSLKKYLKKAKVDIKLVAKIEKPQAIDHLEKIIRISDVVLVARGDLGVEMDLAQVPLIQKKITQLARHLGKPVIVATQMLQSMINNPTCTRAEASDVANAIMDFTDAVMLSGETAIGKYPLKAAETIRRIAAVTENYLDQNSIPRPKTSTSEELVQTAAVAHSVAQIVEEIDAKLVVVWSQTGSTARLLSKNRIDVPILALSSDERASHQMSLHYGVIPRCKQIPDNIENFARIADELILDQKWAKTGEKIVIVAGEQLGAAGTTNTILLHTLTNDT